VGFVREEGDHGVEVGDLADGEVGVEVAGAGLGEGDGGEGFELAVVEGGGFVEGGELDGGGGDAVEGGEGQDCGSPPASWVAWALVFFPSRFLLLFRSGTKGSR